MNSAMQNYGSFTSLQSLRFNSSFEEAKSFNTLRKKPAYIFQSRTTVWVIGSLAFALGPVVILQIGLIVPNFHLYIM